MKANGCLLWVLFLYQATFVSCDDDSHDSPPIAAQGLSFIVNENATIGSVIYTLNFSDEDPGDTVAISTITDTLVKAETPVKIDAKNYASNITLVASLDRDTGMSGVQLFFNLNDGIYTSLARVLMTINDVNDNPPQFVALPYRISIREDYAVGSSVFKVSATDPDFDSGGSIKYNMTAVNTDYKSFGIDPSDGTITLLIHLDYESLSFYHYNVTAKDEGEPPCPGDTCQCKGSDDICKPAPVDLFITIIDVQDTAPIFDRVPYIGTVQENVNQGFSILQVTAVDGDRAASERNLINYAISGGDSSPFVINEMNGVISVKNILDADVDEVRNKGGLFVFNVTATEVSQNGSELHSNPHNSTSTQVSITVTDVNDNPPEFTASNYTARVQENTQSGAPITITGNIEVYDNDQGKNSMFWVYLEKDGAAFDAFETLPKQGSKIQGKSTITIRVVNSSLLDYEKTKSITFQLIAKENNSNPNISTSSTVNVTLYIEDTNDNSPNFPNQQTTFNVSEDSQVGSEITTINAIDEDSGDYGEVTFSLEDDGSDNTFNISDKGVVQLAKPLNREERQSYTIVVVASDSPKSEENQRRKTTLRLVITITDVNDEHPIWTQFIQLVNVLEGAKIGTKVTDLRAVDNDVGLNGEIEYSISPGTNGSELFNVTEVNGVAEIRVQDVLINHVGLLFVKVVAKDKGTPSNNVTFDLSIFVIDENQNSPVFVHPDQSLFNSSIGLLPEIAVVEEQALGSELYTLVATDKDTGQNALVMYYLDPTTNKDYEYFTVDRINGTLRSARRLDKESQGTYEIQVRAEDNGQPAPRYSVLTIRIILTDTDDNQPEYKADSMPQTLQVVEETNDAYVGQLTAAIDLDSYPYSQTCYYLFGGDHLSGFHLDKQSRNLSLTKKVDRELTDILNIVVKATEDCTLPSDYFIDDKNISNVPNPTLITNTPQAYNSSDNSLMWAKVTVLDVNDNPPQFEEHEMLASSVYDTEIGTEILSLGGSITDKDTPSNRRNKFKLQSITPHLESGDSVDTSKEPFLVTANGSVRTNILFSSEILGYFMLQVLAYDDDGMNDTASIKVYLISNLERLLLIFNKKPNEVEDIRNSFSRQLSDILKVDIVVDRITSHVNSDGTRDLTSTDAYIYGRYRDTGKVVPALELRHLLDFNSAARNLLFNSGVTEALTLNKEQTEDESEEQMKYFIIAVSILAVVIVSLFVVLVHIVRLYRRRLRAATTEAYSSPKEKDTLDHPGTNIYVSAENPLFGKEIKPVDQDDDAGSHNSLDVNAVDEPMSSPISQTGRSDEEQELVMQITNTNELGFTSLDFDFEAHSNKAFTKNDDDKYITDNKGRNMQIPSAFQNRYGPEHSGNGHNEQDEETTIYDEIYQSGFPEHYTNGSHLEYTEI